MKTSSGGPKMFNIGREPLKSSLSKMLDRKCGGESSHQENLEKTRGI
jgi:hypothetical protein